MDEAAMRAECISMIDALFDGGEDVFYPVRENAPQIVICGSMSSYALRTRNGPKEYPDAEAVLEALITVEELDDDEDPLLSVYRNLQAIT